MVVATKKATHMPSARKGSERRRVVARHLGAEDGKVVRQSRGALVALVGLVFEQPQR